MAVDDAAVHGDAFARTHAQGLVQPHLGDGDVLLHAIADHARGLGLQADEALDRLGGLAAGAHLQGGAEVNQGDDDGRRLEIGVLRQGGHQVRPSGDGHGIDPGGAGAQGNECVHVGVVVTRRLPCAGEEVAAGIEHHEQGQDPGDEPEDLALYRIESRCQLPQPQHLAHTGDHQRHAHQCRHRRLFHQLAVVGHLGGLFLRLVFLALQFGGTVARLLDRSDQIVGRNIAFHQRSVLGEIDVGLGNADDTAQGILHGRDTTGATHAGDG